MSYMRQVSYQSPQVMYQARPDSYPPYQQIHRNANASICQYYIPQPVPLNPSFPGAPYQYVAHKFVQEEAPQVFYRQISRQESHPPTPLRGGIQPSFTYVDPNSRRDSPQGSIQEPVVDGRYIQLETQVRTLQLELGAKDHALRMYQERETAICAQANKQLNQISMLIQMIEYQEALIQQLYHSRQAPPLAIPVYVPTAGRGITRPETPRYLKQTQQKQAQRNYPQENNQYAYYSPRPQHAVLSDPPLC